MAKFLSDLDYMIEASRSSWAWGRAMDYGGNRPTFRTFSAAEQQLYYNTGYMQASDYTLAFNMAFSNRCIEGKQSYFRLWNLNGRPNDWKFLGTIPDFYFSFLPNNYNSEVHEKKNFINEGVGIAYNIVRSMPKDYSDEEKEDMLQAMICAVQWAADHCFSCARRKISAYEIYKASVQENQNEEEAISVTDQNDSSESQESDSLDPHILSSYMGLGSASEGGGTEDN